MTAQPVATSRSLSAEQLRRLPPAQRDAFLAMAAAAAEDEYRTNRALTEFEAFGKEDLHGDSANTRPR